MLPEDVDSNAKIEGGDIVEPQSWDEEDVGGIEEALVLRGLSEEWVEGGVWRVDVQHLGLVSRQVEVLGGAWGEEHHSLSPRYLH